MAEVIYASGKDADMLYKVKIKIHDPFFYIKNGNKEYVFLDHREYKVFLSKNKNQNLEAVLLNPFLEEIKKDKTVSKSIFKLAKLLFDKYDLVDQEIKVPNSFLLDLADYLREQGFKIIPKDPFYPERAIKSAEEINYIKEAHQLTHFAFKRIEQILQDSEIKDDVIIYQGQVLTSQFLKSEAEKVLLANGMVLSEGLIISSGLQTAVPHDSGSGKILPYAPIICDIFPQNRKSGYFADMTRTYFKGSPSKEIQEMYETVLQAQKNALSVLKSAEQGCEINRIVEDTFLSAGYDVGDKGFVHGTGHGLGLEVHEAPYLNSISEEKLVTGNVFSVEPGLYYEDLGGIRIEDIVVLTDNGYENLTNYPKELKIF